MTELMNEKLKSQIYRPPSCICLKAVWPGHSSLIQVDPAAVFGEFWFAYVCEQRPALKRDEFKNQWSSVNRKQIYKQPKHLKHKHRLSYHLHIGGSTTGRFVFAQFLRPLSDWTVGIYFYCTLLIDVIMRLVTVDDLQDMLIGCLQTCDLTAKTLEFGHVLLLRRGLVLLQSLSDDAVNLPDEGLMVHICTDRANAYSLIPISTDTDAAGQV